MSLEQNVQRGVALLDEKQPGWYQQIDLRRLNMGSLSNCIVGQLGDGYSATLEDLGIEDDVHYGFETPRTDDQTQRNRHYQELYVLWRDIITMRQGMVHAQE